MNNLREEIAKIISDAVFNNATFKQSLLAADKILALISKPTGLVRVSKCPDGFGAKDGTHFDDCLCKGTGIIRTPLTQEEANKLWHEILSCNSSPEMIISILSNGTWKRAIHLSNGDRIEIEGE